MSLGTHNLTGLPGFTINFSFQSGSVFSNAKLTTPLTGVAVRIEDAGSGVQRLFFTERGVLEAMEARFRVHSTFPTASIS